MDQLAVRKDWLRRHVSLGKLLIRQSLMSQIKSNMATKVAVNFNKLAETKTANFSAFLSKEEAEYKLGVGRAYNSRYVPGDIIGIPVQRVFPNKVMIADKAITVPSVVAGIFSPSGEIKDVEIIPISTLNKVTYGRVGDRKAALGLPADSQDWKVLEATLTKSGTAHRPVEFPQVPVVRGGGLRMKTSESGNGLLDVTVEFPQWFKVEGQAFHVVPKPAPVFVKGGEFFSLDGDDNVLAIAKAVTEFSRLEDSGLPRVAAMLKDLESIKVFKVKK